MVEIDGAEEVEKTTVVAPSVDIKLVVVVAVVSGLVENIVEIDELICSDVRGCVLKINVVVLVGDDKVDETAVVPCSLVRTLGIIVAVVGVVEDMVETDELTCANV